MPNFSLLVNRVNSTLLWQLTFVGTVTTLPLMGKIGAVTPTDFAIPFVFTPVAWRERGSLPQST